MVVVGVGRDGCLLAQRATFKWPTMSRVVCSNILAFWKARSAKQRVKIKHSPATREPKMRVYRRNGCSSKVIHHRRAESFLVRLVALEVARDVYEYTEWFLRGVDGTAAAKWAILAGTRLYYVVLRSVVGDGVSIRDWVCVEGC